MKFKSILVLCLISLLLAAGAQATTLEFGARIGAEVRKDASVFTEAFVDWYLLPVLSVGATATYVASDTSRLESIHRDSATPISVAFKVHAPIPVLQPYAGLGEAITFRDSRQATWTPIVLVGVDWVLKPTPLVLNAEYRYHRHDDNNFIGVGVGLRF